MKTKTGKRSWNDVKMALTAITITITIAFWNLFSKIENRAVSAQTVQAVIPQPTATQQVVQSSVVPTTPVNSIIYFNQPITYTLGTGLQASVVPSSPTDNNKIGKTKEKSAKTEAVARSGSSQ